MGLVGTEHESALHSQSERLYNALRVAHALIKKEAATEITVFLMADAVLGAKAGQKTPEGYYSIERMVKRVVAAHGRILLCGTCMDARGLTEAELIEGAHRSTMDELATATSPRKSCLSSENAISRVAPLTRTLMRRKRRAPVRGEDVAPTATSLGG